MYYYSKHTSFTEKEINTICEQFFKIFPKSVLESAYENFSWGKVKSSDEAINVRNGIYKQFSAWANSGSLQKNADEQIQKVHKWGFGRNLDKRESILLEEPYLTSFIDMIRNWQISEDPKKMLTKLETCLLTPYVKIARFSKWICFIDQSKYAIYDSRVSLALRNILLNEKRVFPTLGARSKGRPNGDFISTDSQVSAKKVAAIYMVYLDMLHTTIQEYNFSSVAQMEMALFMLGTEQKYW
tara:strand:- start:28 stop:750 length:723 start_codon:yes stop_codon:yes gene_type:complete